MDLLRSAALGLAVAVVCYLVWGTGDVDSDGLSNFAEWYNSIDANRDKQVSGEETLQAIKQPFVFLALSWIVTHLGLLSLGAFSFYWFLRKSYQRNKALVRFESSKDVPTPVLQYVNEANLDRITQERSIQPCLLRRATSSNVSGSRSASRRKTFQTFKSLRTQSRKGTETRSRATSCVELPEYMEMNLCQEIEQAGLSDEIYEWDFDMFDLAEKFPRPLVVVGFTCMQRFTYWMPDTSSSIELDKVKLISFLNDVENNYKEVPYHNKLHGAAVARSAAAMCVSRMLEEGISPKMQFALVFAGLIHDVAHPGLSNDFLKRASDPMSVTYSDDSALEHMHLATAFRLLQKECNRFLKDEYFNTIRQPVVGAVLGTDMARHGEQVQRLRALQDNLKHGGSDGSIPWYWPRKPPPSCKTQEEQKDWIFKRQEEFVTEVILHACDIATPAMHFDQFRRWNHLVELEFHAQGDRELAEFGYIFSVKDGFDRNASPLLAHKFHVGFVVFLVKPFYSMINECSGVKVDGNCFYGMDLSVCMTHLENNTVRLKEIEPKETEPRTA